IALLLRYIVIARSAHAIMAILETQFRAGVLVARMTGFGEVEIIEARGSKRATIETGTILRIATRVTRAPLDLVAIFAALPTAFEFKLIAWQVTAVSALPARKIMRPLGPSVPFAGMSPWHQQGEQ